MRALVCLLALVGCRAPLRMKLENGTSGTSRIRYQMANGESGYGATMDLSWAVRDGEVVIGPVVFSGSEHAPHWPQGATAQFRLSPQNRDSHWTLSAPPNAEHVDQWKDALRLRYCLGVGVVRLPEEAVNEWSFDENDPPLHTNYQYQVVQRNGDQVRIGVRETTRVDGDSANENVSGEVAYDLTRPLPVGGWMQISTLRGDGSTMQTRYDYGN